MKKQSQMLEPQTTGAPQAIAFLNGYRQLEKPSEQAAYLRKWYALMFGDSQMPSVAFGLIRTRIAMELQVRAIKSAGVKLPPKLQALYDASKTFKLENFLGDMRFFLGKESNQQSAKEIKQMAIKEPKKDSKAGAVTRAWISIMQENPKMKLSDSAIAAAMRKAFPTKKAYHEVDVFKVRSLWNRGLLKGQIGKPLTPLQAFNPVKATAVASKPASAPQTAPKRPLKAPVKKA